MLVGKDIQIESPRCLNQRLKNASCAICQENCPRRAIVIDDSTGSVSVTDDCTACGICVNSCPSQVFGWVNTSRYPLQAINGKVAIYCQQVTCEGYVRCLANLNVYEIVYLALHREVTIYIDVKECANCGIAIMALLQVSCQDANKFLDKVNKNTVNLAYTQKGALENVNRRQFFGLLFTKLKQSVVETLPLAATATNYRYLVRQAIKQLSLPVASDAAPLFWGIKVSDNCRMCGLCVKICKNHALLLSKAGTAANLLHNQDNCIGCGACVRLCPHQSLIVSGSDSKLSKVGQADFASVNNCELTKCRCCQSYFIDEKTSGICDACQRKAMNRPQAIY